MSTATSPLNAFIGNNVNQYYSWNNNSVFYSLSSPYLVQFYQQRVRIWDYWSCGYVPSFHNQAKGLLPTGIGRTICKKTADLIYGEGVVYKALDNKNDDEISSLDFVSNTYSKNEELDKKIKDVIGKSVELGNGLLKLNCDEDNELWIDAIAGNRFFVNLNSRGQITMSRTYINIFTNGIANQKSVPDSYGLVEERYWKTETEIDGLGRETITKKPVMVHKIYKLGIANVFTSDNNASYDYKGLPRSIQEQFRAEYGDIMLNEEQYIPLIDLGVYLIKHTDYITDIPNVKMGESVLANCLNYLMLYDTAFSENYNDLYVSRAKVLLPSFMGKGVKQGAFDGFDDFLYTKVPNMSDEDQTPTIFAPNLRIEQFQKLREECCKNLCSAIGVSTSSIFSDIQDSRGAVTATEISSEESNTSLWVSNKRMIFLKELNRMLKTILLFYGKLPDVEITFAPVGSSNKHLMVEDTVKLKEANIISEYEAQKQLNPRSSESQIEEELDEIHKTPNTNSNNFSNVE